MTNSVKFEKIMSEKIETRYRKRATTLNESIQDYNLIEGREEALNEEHRQVEDLLNESSELEKKSGE